MRPGCIFNVGFIKLTLNFSILEITRKLIQYVHSPVFLLPGAENVTKLSLKWLYLAIVGGNIKKGSSLQAHKYAYAIIFKISMYIIPVFMTFSKQISLKIGNGINFYC